MSLRTRLNGTTSTLVRRKSKVLPYHLLQPWVSPRMGHTIWMGPSGVKISKIFYHRRQSNDPYLAKRRAGWNSSVKIHSGTYTHGRGSDIRQPIEKRYNCPNHSDYR